MIAITLGGARWDTCLATYSDAIPFLGVPASELEDGTRNPPEAKQAAIALTMHNLAVTAVTQRWDRVLVIQDDVRFRGEIPIGIGVFGRYRGRDHWCPQAFRFDRLTWKRARTVWNGKTQVCRAWSSLIATLPRFDLASDHLDEPPLAAIGRNAGCRGCGH